MQTANKIMEDHIKETIRHDVCTVLGYIRNQTTLFSQNDLVPRLQSIGKSKLGDPEKFRIWCCWIGPSDSNVKLFWSALRFSNIQETVHDFGGIATSFARKEQFKSC